VKEGVAMKTRSCKAAQAAIAALLLCAMCGAARAKLHDESPATAAAADLVPLRFDEERADEAAARALEQRRQAMIEDCEQNNGIDCAREVDTELGAELLQGTGGVIHLRRSR
jgi:hypothetical protein